MTPDGLRVFSSAYERAMRQPAGGDDDRPASAAGFRAVLFDQLARLLDALAGRAPYVSHLEAAAVAPADVDSATGGA